MASNSASHAARPGTRPRSKRVTEQHTLERVRNNQRLHRARRRDYIATLERKLSQAEQSVAKLRDQVDALQAELSQCRNQDCKIMSSCAVLPEQQLQLQSLDGHISPAPLPSTQGTGFQASGRLLDAISLDILAPSTPLPIQYQLSDDLPADLGLNVISPHVRPEDAGGPTFEIPDLALQATDCQLVGRAGALLSTTATPDPALTTTGTCCSEGRSSTPDGSTTDENAVDPSREISPSLLGYAVQPATRSYDRYDTESESTMLCAEAYLLIAQQNFKGVSEKDVATWLWHGFRKSARRGEGCRVKTDLLFSLLTFISDA